MLLSRVFICRFAPITGAWIETFKSLSSFWIKSFAPITGAWIETDLSHELSEEKFNSHPSRVRGLKLKGQHRVTKNRSSHPSRVRGLKLDSR